MTESIVNKARKLLAVKSRKRHAFGAELFPPGAWDILLAVQAADGTLRERELPDRVRSDGPALWRWVDVLEHRHLIISTALVGGQRELQLSRRARALMAQILEDGGGQAEGTAELA